MSKLKPYNGYRECEISVMMVVTVDVSAVIFTVN